MIDNCSIERLIAKVGGFLGVFGYEKQTISELAEEFQMKENALQKAKDTPEIQKQLYHCFQKPLILTFNTGAMLFLTENTSHSIIRKK